MRHKRKTVKLQRKAAHRDALLANLAKSIIEHRRIRTTLAKAKAARPFVEKLVTCGKKALAAKKAAAAASGDEANAQVAAWVHQCRMAYRTLQSKDLVKKLVDEVAAASEDRVGGYTRITKLGQRSSDSAPMAYLEFVDYAVAASEEE
jgi:large subunit ribosomal protein L17